MIDNIDDEFERAIGGGPKPKTRAALTAAQFAALPLRQVPCGYFTLTLTDGALKRFRVRVERGSFVPGHRTLSIFRKLEVGPEPHAERLEHEWQTLAVLGPGGFNLFKTFRGTWEERWAAALWALLDGKPAGGYAVSVEPRCWMTMRELKDDSAKRTGLCAAWRKRFEVE